MRFDRRVLGGLLVGLLLGGCTDHCLRNSDCGNGQLMCVEGLCVIRDGGVADLSGTTTTQLDATVDMSRDLVSDMSGDLATGLPIVDLASGG